MRGKTHVLLAVAALLAAYISIGASIVLSPWFSWERNALSDLGHSAKSVVAPIFNFGLLLTGVLILIYAVTIFRREAKYTSLCLAVSSFLLQLVAMFDEIYGYLHYVVSVLFFVSLGITLLVFAVEKRSILAVILFFSAFTSWILYWFKAYTMGIAVPETISAIVVTLWLLVTTFRMHLEEKSSSFYR